MLSNRLWRLSSIVNVLALLFIIQINVGLIPTFPAPPGYLVPAGVDKFNSLVSDLSQGVIISSLFFYLLVFIPAKHRAKQVKEAYHESLQWLIMQLLVIELYIKKEFDVSRESLDISPPTDLTFSAEKKIRFSWKYLDVSTVPFLTGDTFELTWLKTHCDPIIGATESILLLPHITSEDKGLINLLLKVQRLHLISCLRQRYGLEKSVSVGSPAQALRDFFTIIDDLKKIYGDNVRVIVD